MEDGKPVTAWRFDEENFRKLDVFQIYSLIVWKFQENRHATKGDILRVWKFLGSGNFARDILTLWKFQENARSIRGHILRNEKVDIKYPWTNVWTSLHPLLEPRKRSPRSSTVDLRRSYSS